MPLTFGKYEIHRRLAVGGMGEVFLAVQRGLPGAERLVIIKTLLPDLAQVPELANQFLDEARVIASLNHPNVVSLLEVGVWERTPFIAMELIKGRTVSQLRRIAREQRRAIDPWSSATIAADAARGLHHAHLALDASGEPLLIIHRDVSPQNLMVRMDGVTKVLDFGIASATNRATRTATGVLKGKLVYMAPEQISGGEVTSQADQFALGVVLWELLADQRLFQGDSEAAVAKQILADPIPLPSSTGAPVPPALEAIVLRMLERRPGDRFADCGAVAAELDRAMAGNLAGGSAALGQLMESLGTEDITSAGAASGLDASPALLLPSSPAPTSSGPASSSAPTIGSTRRTPQSPGWTRAGMIATALALFAGAALGLRWWSARAGALGKLQTLVEQNAWLADRSLERFCKVNAEVAPLWPRAGPLPGRDAAEFFAGRLGWIDTIGKTLQAATLVIPKVPPLPDDAGPSATWLQMVSADQLASADLGWMSDLAAYDHWTVDPPLSLAAQEPARLWPWEARADPWTLPAPRVIPLQSAAKLRLSAGLAEGDIRPALAEVNHLRDLARSTNLLIGEMIGVALSRIEAAAIEESGRRGQPPPEQHVLTLEEAKKIRSVVFAGPGFFLPGVPVATMRRAAACSVSPCSAMLEAAAYYSALGPNLTEATASAEGMVSVAMATPGCDARLIARQAQPQPFDPVAAVSALDRLNKIDFSTGRNSDPGGLPAGRVLDLQ